MKKLKQPKGVILEAVFYSNKKDVIRFIQVFSKEVEHNKIFINNVYEIFKDEKLDNMACMAILIKD